ncbi:MAG TPA: hypothetical protein VG826_31965 [Pirellulales bacterium]|nr:hypothetical protein [Pirellulales bacterium]
MSTVTHLEQFRGLSRFELSRRPDGQPVDEGAKLRELWSDSLATVAAVTLASILVFETLRIVLWQ